MADFGIPIPDLTIILLYRIRNFCNLSQHKFFVTKKDFLVYCIDIQGLFEKVGIIYNACVRRLFIGSSKHSLKVVLLNNGNLFASVSISHFTQIKECYENMALLFTKLKNSDLAWKICVDIKAFHMLRGKQS